VLFAILIATVGLLGAIAVFPVASAQARKGRLYDAMAVAGRSCVHTFDAMGMRRPDRWYQWNTQLNPHQFDLVAVHQGECFCIDSRFVVANYLVGANANVFPYEWQDPNITTLNNLPLADANGNPAPRMRRVAFFGQPYLDINPNGQPGLVANTIAGNKLQADNIFFIEDDLAYFRPGTDELPESVTNARAKNDKTLPAVQNYDFIPGTTTLSRRQTRGEFSWMATLVPKVDVLTFVASDQYQLSIVMFHQRPSLATVTGANDTTNVNGENERVVNVYVEDGNTGGEVLLYWPSTTQTQQYDDIAALRLKLKAGDWVMLGGILVHRDPQTNQVLSRFPRFQWYRVSDTDEISYEPADATINQARYERRATLIGQDWNIDVNSQLQNQQATIVEGVIGVYEKTVRLEYGEAL
jgi:hypothetical protein